MNLKRFLSTLSLAAAILPGSVASAQTLVNVYVQAGSGGFAANGANDTALDLRKALLGKNRTLRVVESPEQADLVVRIDSSNDRKETGSVSTYANQSKDGKSGSATTYANEKTIHVLHGTLIAGEFQMPLQDESALSWRLAASDMASDVDHWAKENHDKLMEKRLSNHGAASARQAMRAAPEPPASQTSSAQDQTASIAPGMNEAQVANAMGEPEKKIVFGKKALWNYRGMQVVFEEGKVTDVKF